MNQTDEVAAVGHLFDQTAKAHKIVMRIPNYREELCALFSFDENLHPIGVYGVVFPEDGSKAGYLQAMMNKLSEDKAWAYVFLCEGWTVAYDKATKKEDIFIRPRDDDRRVECLTMYYESKSGLKQFRSYKIQRKPLDLIPEVKETESVETIYSGLLEGGLLHGPRK